MQKYALGTWSQSARTNVEIPFLGFSHQAYPHTKHAFACFSQPSGDATFAARTLASQTFAAPTLAARPDFDTCGPDTCG